MFDFHEDTEVHTIWFVGGEGTDWMAAVYRHKDSPWQFKYRFRYSKSPDPFDGEDKKNWYQWTPKEGNGDKDIDRVISTIRKMAGVIGNQYDAEVCELPIHGNGDAAIDTLIGQPWCHFKREDANEHDRQTDKTTN